MPFIDNGDGTITTEDGVRIAKPYGMGGGAPPPFMVNPGLAAAANPLPDLRTASAEDAIKAALAPKAAGGGITLPDQMMTDAPIAGPGVPARPTGRRTEAEIRDADAQNRRNDLNLSQMGGGAGNIVAGALGVKGLPTPAPPKPKGKDGEEEGDTVSKEDRIQAQGAGIAMGGGPGMIAPRVIDKGGMRPFSRQIEEGRKLPPGTQDQFDKNIEAHKAANQTALAAGVDQSVESFAAADIRERQVAKEQLDEQKRVERHSQVMDESMAKFDKMATEAREKPVNTDTYWEEKGWGAHMLAGLYVAMNEVAKRPGEKNEAKDTIDKQIDRWIEDKKERRAQGLESQRTLIGQLRENFQSEGAQRAGLRAQAYDAYQAKLQTIAASASTEKEKAAAMELNASLEDRKLEQKTKAAQSEADHVVTTEKVAPPVVAGGGGGLAPLDRGLVVEDLNGNKYLARDAERARKLTSQQPLTKVAVDAANTMTRIAKKAPGQKLDPSSTDGKEFGFAQEQFTNAMNILQEQNAVKADDMQRYKEHTGGMLGWSTAEAAQKLASKARTAYGYQLAAGADTATKVSEDFAQNPKTGVIDKVARYQLYGNGQGGQVPIAFTAVGKKKHGGRK